MNEKNATVKVVQGTSKKGNIYECLEFSFDCGNGIVYSSRAFPSPLEMQVIKSKLGGISQVYAETSAKSEVF